MDFVYTFAWTGLKGKDPSCGFKKLKDTLQLKEIVLLEYSSDVFGNIWQHLATYLFRRSKILGM